MTSVTTAPPTLRPISAFAPAASLRRSYSCYSCNYSFHIIPTANTSSSSPSSFRCPRCHHRHPIPHHTIAAPPPSPALPSPNSHLSLAISRFNYQTSEYQIPDDSYSGDEYDSDDSVQSLPSSYYYWNQSTPALKSFVDSLPVVKFPTISTPSAQSCPICIEDFEVNSDASGIINELPCKHYFHRDCIVEWLRSSNTCPLCRHILPSDQSPEIDIFRGAYEFDLGDDATVTISVADLASARENSGDGSLDSNLPISVSDGGEISEWELDAMRDEDGDTLMIDAS